MKTNLKKQLLLGLFLSITNLLSAQIPCWSEHQMIYYVNFDDGNCMEGLAIDTASNVNNVWQIGAPQKNVFNNSYSAPNAIVTDTLNSYPANDTSSFIFSHIASLGFYYHHTVSIEGYFYVNSDTLNDFGLIELSPDNGNTWYDIVNDPQFTSSWESQKPILTGNSNGWNYFKFNTLSIADPLGITYGDTLKYRFTFISDENQDTFDGLMFDNFVFEDYMEGIDELGSNRIESKSYPNPVSNSVTVEINNPQLSAFELQLIDVTGKEVLSANLFNQNSIELDISTLDPGIYTYIIRSSDKKNWSSGKIIKTN
jgi:hypothetical protein